MAKRPVNRCDGCGHTWYPRGADKSASCPKCGGEAITTAVEQRGRTCCCCLMGLAVVVGLGWTNGRLKKNDPIESGVADRIRTLHVDAAGTNAIKIRFSLSYALNREVASDGELRVSLRPWSGTSVGEELAAVTTSVSAAQFSRNVAGTPEVEVVLPFTPRAAMPAGTSWVQADVTFTPRGGGPIRSAEKCIHDAVRFEGGAGGPEAPATDLLGEARDLSQAAAASFGGKFRAKFVRVVGEPSFGRGLLVALESAEQPGQHALTAWLPESLVQRLEGDGTLPRLIQQKPTVVVVLIPGVGEQPPGVSRLEVQQ